MFHMHSSFDLRAGVEIAEFRTAWEALAAELIARDAMVSATGIMERCADTPLDTDAARGHRYFGVMSFRDRAQSEAAWDQIAPRTGAMEKLHGRVWGMVADPVFSCWQD